MAGSSKKEKRRAKKAQKFAAQQQQQQSSSSSSSSSNNNNGAVQLPAEEFYKMVNDEFNKVPQVGRFMDGFQRNMVRGTLHNWTLRFTQLPSVVDKSLFWLQILQVDEQKAAQLKLYALGSRVAFSEDDSNVVQRSRKLFKDAAPSFMNDYGLWILSRSLVKKGFGGSADDDALEFGAYDPLECLSEMPLNLSDGICCAEIFLFFAIDGDVPGDDLNSRESVMDFLSALNSTEGTRKIHAFSVVAASVTTIREKLNELRGKHLTGDTPVVKQQCTIV